MEKGVGFESNSKLVSCVAEMVHPHTNAKEKIVGKTVGQLAASRSDSGYLLEAFFDWQPRKRLEKDGGG